MRREIAKATSRKGKCQRAGAPKDPQCHRLSISVFRKDHESLVLRDAQTYSHLFTGGRIDLALIVSAQNHGRSTIDNP
jgi:hypothetical protein